MDQQALQWIIIGVTVAFIAFEKAMKLLKNNPKNYGERIATLEKAVEIIEGDIKEIKDKM